MSNIKTRQMRRLRHAQLGEYVIIQATFTDRPATIETWIDHCGTLASECKMAPLDVHVGLQAMLPPDRYPGLYEP